MPPAQASPLRLDLCRILHPFTGGLVGGALSSPRPPEPFPFGKGQPRPSSDSGTSPRPASLSHPLLPVPQLILRATPSRSSVSCRLRVHCSARHPHLDCHRRLLAGVSVLPFALCHSRGSTQQPGGPLKIRVTVAIRTLQAPHLLRDRAPLQPPLPPPAPSASHQPQRPPAVPQLPWWDVRPDALRSAGLTAALAASASAETAPSRGPVPPPVSSAPFSPLFLLHLSPPSCPRLSICHPWPHENITSTRTTVFFVLPTAVSLASTIICRNARSIFVG